MKTSELFNQIRQSHVGQVLSSLEIKELLKDFPRSKDKSFLHLMVEHGCLIKVSKNQYRFPYEPVYTGKLEAVIDTIRKRTRESVYKYLKHKAITEDSAIKFLLNTGKYEIYKVETIIKKTKVCV